MRRGLAQALLPASILPVLVLGPGLARSPETLWRHVSAELQRLSEGGSGGGAAHHRRGAAAKATPAHGMPVRVTHAPAGAGAAAAGTARP